MKRSSVLFTRLTLNSVLCTEKLTMKNRLIIYVGTDDDIRSPLFSCYEETSNWTRAKSLVSNALIESCQEGRHSRKGWLNSMMDSFFGKQTIPFEIPDFNVLHDLEMKKGMTIWNLIQIAENGRPHPAIVNKVSNKTKWLLSVDESSSKEAMDAWLKRSWICASRDFGRCYASAVDLVGQMMAVQEEGINHETTLCLLRMCVDEMPSRLLSQGELDPLSQVSQRGEFTRFVQKLTGVRTEAIYTLYSPLAENNPVPAVLPFLGSESYDQIVLEDCKTRVLDLEAFRQQLRQNREIIDLRGSQLR